MKRVFEKEIFYKSVLLNKFGYYGNYPFSYNYKQLETITQLLYNKKLYCVDKEKLSIDEMLKISKQRQYTYATEFLEKKNKFLKKLDNLTISLDNDLLYRITNLDSMQVQFILSILENENDTEQQFELIFGYSQLNYEMFTCLVDIYIEPLKYIKNLNVLLQNTIDLLKISKNEKLLMKDYIYDKISEFERVDFLNKIFYCCEKNDKLYEDFLHLPSYQYFQCKEFLICLKDKTEKQLQDYLKNIIKIHLHLKIKNFLFDFAFLHKHEDILLASLDIDNKYPLLYFFNNYDFELQDDEKEKINSIIQEWVDKKNSKRKYEELGEETDVLQLFKKMKIEE